MKTAALFSTALLSLSTFATAAIQSHAVLYKDGDTVLEGFVAYDDAVTTPRPGIIVVHDWTGLQDYAKRRATMLAELGYVAFAADIYGQGVRPNDPAECGKQAGKFKSDLPLLRKRMSLTLGELLKQPGVDTQKIAAVGYCFGGTSVLELARSGAKVSGVVSFHGNLATTMPADQGAVKAKVLVCQGTDDPYVKPEERAAFRQEFDRAQVDYTVIDYPDAVHSFTKPEAGNDKSQGQAYNEAADKKSWNDMQAFFKKIWKE